MSVHKIGKFGGDDNAKFEARMEAGKVALKKRVEANTISLESDEFKFEARIYGAQMLKVIEEILTGNTVLKNKLPESIIGALSKFGTIEDIYDKEKTEKMILILIDYFTGEDQEINPMLEKEVKDI